MNRLAFRMGLLAGATLLVASAPAWAQNNWERNRGNCHEVLSVPEQFELSDVRECAQRWESYGGPEAISREVAQRYARGFSRLYYQGSRSDQTLAQTALERLGLSVLPEGDFIPDERLEAFLSRDRSPIYVGGSDSRDRRRAQEHNRDGMREYERGNYESAANEFRAALDDDPWYYRAKYNLACQLALLGRADEAIRHLDELDRWDSPEADEQFSHALTDQDFISLHDDVRFRLLTGYARIQLLNGADDAGLARVQEIHDALIAQGYDIASYGYDRYSRARPLIYYRRGYEEVADTVAEILASDQARRRLLSWASDYDLIVVWGQPALSVRRPIVQGLLRVDGGDPEEAVDDVVDVGEAAAEAVEDPGAAAEEAVQEWMPGN